jgi:hypothetical protein
VPLRDAQNASKKTGIYGIAMQPSAFAAGTKEQVKRQRSKVKGSVPRHFLVRKQGFTTSVLLGTALLPCGFSLLPFDL